jgi:hypothetical protein
MHISVLICTLAGLFLDIAGAFCLAVDAIGAEKIQAKFRKWFWRLYIPFMLMGSEHPTNAKRAFETLLKIMLWTGFAVGVLVGVRKLIIDVSPINIIWIPLWGLIGALLALAILLISDVVIIAIMVSLFWIQIRSKDGTIGAKGFTMLLVGFVLQVIAAILNYFTPV